MPQGAKQQIGACAAGWECFIEEPGFSEITIQSIADPTEVPYRGSLPIKVYIYVYIYIYVIIHLDDMFTKKDSFLQMFP